MKNTLEKLAKWICRQLTFDEFSSLVALMLDILNGTKSGYEFKPPPKTENYRKFRVDPELPLTEPPLAHPSSPKLDWRELKAAKEKETGKPVNPVLRRGKFNIPEHCCCEHCGAPSQYLYLNDGKKGNQVRCKICNSLSSSERVRRESKAKYYCPHCGSPLFLWKKNVKENIFKCPNNKCPCYISAEAKLTAEEKAERKQQPYNPNYKLHYQYREWHLSPEDLRCNRLSNETKVNLNRIHNSYHVVGLVLSLFINCGLTSRTTRNVLWGFFGIKLSHQTVINYVNAAAAHVSPFLDDNLPKPSSIAAADETYLIVENEWHYTWLVIDCNTKAICGYNLSDTRGTVPALATLYNAYGPPESNQNKKYTLVRDGLPSYDEAMVVYNQEAKEQILTGKTVVGLENRDDVSKEFRPEKNMIERLNRTYKFHTRPRAGMKSLNGALALTTLFVSYYNYLRPHSSLRRPPVVIDELLGIERYPLQWTALLTLASK